MRQWNSIKTVAFPTEPVRTNAGDSVLDGYREYPEPGWRIAKRVPPTTARHPQLQQPLRDADLAIFLATYVVARHLTCAATEWRDFSQSLREHCAVHGL